MTHALDILDMTFDWVLVLVVGLILIIFDALHAKNIVDRFGGFGLGIITAQAFHCTMVMNELFEGMGHHLFG